MTRTFFGLDLSTQQLKGAVVNDNLKIIHEALVKYDIDLPEFHTSGGVIIDKSNPRVITAPTIMWVKALDILMDKLKSVGTDFSKIAAISGSAQQHGSVFWQKGSEKRLEELDPSKPLHQQLASTFATGNSPVWMDSSTSKQCKQLEDAVGGPQKLAEITGSRAYERFTGSQIAKLQQTNPEAYKNSERISLVSSFLCSVFLGKVAPIDISDGSGMNLMDIKTKKWCPQLLKVIGSDLEEKLGSVVPSNTNLGVISSYFVKRYSFDPNCRVIACTGDNPASLVGMRLNEGWLAVSLGTSDTVFLWIKEPKIVLNGHILCNPVDPNAYMAMLCFKNGALTRKRIRIDCAKSDWNIFNQMLESTPRGNSGNIGFYFDVQEILPFLSGDYRFNKSDKKVAKFSSLEIEVRALVEGQFIAKKAYAEDIGFNLDKDTKILATGGASINKAILQVLSDVFNAPVYVQDQSESAMLGAAYQAKHGLLSGEKKYFEIMASLPPPRLMCQPNSGSREIYEPMVARYRRLEASILQK